jgi:hypothetical protein
MSLAELVITSVTVEGRTKSEVARDYRISRYWVHQLVKRFAAEGEAAFVPRSRRPHGNPHAVETELEERIVRLRKQLSKQGWDGLRRPSQGQAHRPPCPAALPSPPRPRRHRRSDHDPLRLPAASHRPGPRTRPHTRPRPDRRPPHPRRQRRHRPAPPRAHPRPQQGLPAPRPTPRTPTKAPAAPAHRAARSRRSPRRDRRHTPPQHGRGPEPNNARHATMSRDTCQRCPGTSQQSG